MYLHYPGDRYPNRCSYASFSYNINRHYSINVLHLEDDVSVSGLRSYGHSGRGARGQGVGWRHCNNKRSLEQSDYNRNWSDYEYTDGVRFL